MIILGIDPGSRCMGCGLVRCVDGAFELIEHNVFRPSGAMALHEIYDHVSQLIGAQQPDVCAIEMPVYGRNPQSMLKLGRAQAAAMLAAMHAKVPVTEYSPKEVKRSVTGNGNASKEQVWYMIRSLLSITDEDEHLVTDASDALAVALCHGHRLNKDAVPSSAATGGWASFVRQNPERVKRT